ncbi:MAG: MotA/TolQ/ExbB proton channel family protein [Gammaproteobacteria bacterium]|nr:MotA/TolQ/ExbB proton channel family protein [Gammaproteobacteria bacterium]
MSSDGVVTLTLYVLILFSVATWTVVLYKVVQHLRASLRNRAYIQAFWAAPNLPTARALALSPGPASRIGEAGFEVLEEADDVHDLAHSGNRRELLERCLRQQLQKERRALEGGLALLASIGSTSPFVGLFGTVWGIMYALQDITKAGNASLDVVAGPIGEALIATAVGIAVAVPAVLAYNFFLRRMKTVIADLDDFATDFLNLAARTGFRLERAS